MEMSEGDIVSTFNKTLDVMRQVRDMLVKNDPEHHLRYDLQEADKLMRRGVVEMAYTLGFAPASPAAPVEPAVPTDPESPPAPGGKETRAKRANTARPPQKKQPGA
jgi:hypothetical protein